MVYYSIVEQRLACGTGRHRAWYFLYKQKHKYMGLKNKKNMVFASEICIFQEKVVLLQPFKIIYLDGVRNQTRYLT